MGRELRRVPMDFDYPKGKVWYGYLIGYVETCKSTKNEKQHCQQCKNAADIIGVPMTPYGCPDFDAYLAEPIKKLKELLAHPAGEGYQLWETTSEGSPISPVFGTLDELCEWCEKNATTFADFKATKDEWKQMLDDNIVCHKQGNVIYM